LTGGNFPAISSNADRFNGTYDGDGKTITGLTMTVTTSYQGFFGYIGDGTVKNVNLTGTITITGSGLSCIGGIAGANYSGTIDNCVFNGTVSGTSYDQIGGIVGRNIGTVINSRSTATVSGNNSAGGIAGRNNGKIENSYNTGSVTGNQQAGGIAGENTVSGSYVKNSYNTGNITATASSNSYVGGIVGTNTSSALVEYCYNTGNVTGTTGAGGIVGNNASGCTVRNCVSLGLKVTGGSTNTGRVVGAANGTLTNNKAREDMRTGASGSEATVASGAASATNGNGANVTVGSSTALSSVFSGWDTAIWNISGNLTAGGSLPTLKAATQSPAPTLPSP